MSIKAIAQELIADGWAVIPIPKGSKAATGKWNETVYGPDDFATDEGIAAKCGAPSGDRVCVDCDDLAAVTAAEIMLPYSLVEGRPGKPDSHHWFIATGAKHVTYKHLKDDQGRENTIIELLATGQYALVPPSLHPSGEQRAWSKERPIMRIEPDYIARLVRNVAASVLLATHFPGSGARHDPRLALAGYLYRLNVEERDILHIGRAVMTIIKGDVQDWLETARTTLAKLKDQDAIVTGGPKLAELLDRGPEVIARLDKWFGKSKRTDQRALRFTSADAISLKSVDWLYDKRIPMGSLGLLAGREGLGKSLTLLDIGARITRGTLDGIYHGQPKTVLLAATEDSWEHVIAPRLTAANADLTRVIRVDVETPEGLDDLSLPVDLSALQQHITERGDVALMMLDPLISRLSGKLDTHKDAEVRRALEPLVRLADVTGMAVIGIIHVNKNVATDPLNTVMGSRAFPAVARFVLFVVEDPNDESIRLFGQPKNNLGPSNQNTLTFVVEDALVATTSDGKAIRAGRVNWTGHDPRSIRQILQEANDMKQPNKTGDAVRWLRQYLEQRQGAADSKAVKTDGFAVGFSQSTLKRAAATLHIAVVSIGFPRRTWWTLPGATVNLGHLANQP